MHIWATKANCRYINNAIGLVYCSNGLYIDDKGNIGTNHKYFKESEKKLAKLQRRLAKNKALRKEKRNLITI